MDHTCGRGLQEILSLDSAASWAAFVVAASAKKIDAIDLFAIEDPGLRDPCATCMPPHAHA